MNSALSPADNPSTRKRDDGETPDSNGNDARSQSRAMARVAVLHESQSAGLGSSAVFAFAPLLWTQRTLPQMLRQGAC
jgi:hypothetical protein